MSTYQVHALLMQARSRDQAAAIPAHQLLMAAQKAKSAPQHAAA
jgi:hypothetical protein